MNGEEEFVDRIQKLAQVPNGAGVVLGIGDDCAVIRPRGAGEDLLFTTDMLIEGVHFRPDTYSAEDLGYKALARGLSDIAAMGGEPRFCLLSLCLASWTDQRWRNGFLRGFLELAAGTGAALAGGDVAQGRQVMCDVVVSGAVPRDKALRRDGATPGDAVYVSGELGGSALGLETQKGRAWKQHLRPQPRLKLGRFLRERLHATACMDLSDGLSLDLRRLCRASGVSADIEPPPRFPGASLEQALHGGEDYELLFTVREGTRVPAEFDGVRLTRIGAIEGGRAGKVMLSKRPLQPLGYDHFRSR